MTPAVAARLRRLRARPGAIGAALMSLIAGLAWAFRFELNRVVRSLPALIPASATGMGVILLVLSASLTIEHNLLQNAWKRRTRAWTGLARVGRRPRVVGWLLGVGDPLEWLMRPVVRSRPGSWMAELWVNSGLGSKPSRFLLAVAAAALLGWWTGSLLAGPLLGAALTCLAALAPVRFVASRTADRGARFRQQLPGALDALAAGLAFGLSFNQAAAFAERELPEPIAATFRRLLRRLNLGFPIEAALMDLLGQQDDETLELVVEGILLQRQFGGNLVRMLEETAVLLRGRAELEREVRAVTTQGRLSGWVIAGLVPVSAALLLLTNPRYIDVLFETLIGQALLVLALLLQLIGWLIISRLVRVRY